MLHGTSSLQLDDLTLAASMAPIQDIVAVNDNDKQHRIGTSS